MENNMTRDKNTIRDRLKTFVGIMSVRIAKKNAWFGFSEKFVIVVWFKPRIAKTTKNFEVEVVGRFVK